MLSLPVGIGLATLRSLLLLWAGFGYRRSGVRSAGNGLAMRAPILGVFFAENEERLTEFVDLSSTITHTDSRAIDGARIAARVVAYNIQDGGSIDAVSCAEECLRDTSSTDLAALVRNAADLAQRVATPEEAARELGVEKGITDFINHTVPAVLYCWWRYPSSPKEGLSAMIGMGGDADTTAAILGGIYGGVLGRSELPEEWLAGICDWPRSKRWIDRLGKRLAVAHEHPGDSPGPCPLFWLGYLIRSPLFIVVVLLHGLRRLLPPY